MNAEIGDHHPAWNDIGLFEARIKVSPTVRPGQVILYDGWEPYQFKGYRSHQAILPSPLNPIQLAGGYVPPAAVYAHRRARAERARDADQGGAGGRFPHLREDRDAHPVCESLGIEYPILAFSHCGDVVAAVRRVGGLCVLGAVAFTPEELERIDTNGGGKPYGVDVVIPDAYFSPTRSDRRRTTSSIAPTPRG